MKDTKEIIEQGGDIWQVKNVKEVRYQLAKKGTIERHLKGISLSNGWLVDYLDYHVTVRHRNEDFDRTFVYTEQEAEDVLFTK